MFSTSTAHHSARPGSCFPLLLLLLAMPCFGQRANRTERPQNIPELLAELSSGAALRSIPDPAVTSAGAGQQVFPPTGPRRERMPGLRPTWIPIPRPCITDYCSAAPPQRSCCERENTSQFETYLLHNVIHIYTPRELGSMAIHGVIDPFNLLTIVGTSAFSVGIDANSPYGPGAMGIAKLSGTTLSADMVNAFFETFLIPSIDHQDPRYHRMPNAPLAWRIAHCLYQPFWTVSDTGKPMVNYSNLLGSVADEAVFVTYVPFQEKGLAPSAARVGLNLATTPIGNVITEFFPDVARHININVVFFQRIINRVAIEEAVGPSAPAP